MRQSFDREPINPELRKEVWRRDKGACRYCGWCSGPRHLDHVLPVSLGGRSEACNLVVACRSCNLSKGTQLWEPLPNGKHLEPHWLVMNAKKKAARRDRKRIRANGSAPSGHGPWKPHRGHLYPVDPLTEEELARIEEHNARIRAKRPRADMPWYAPWEHGASTGPRRLRVDDGRQWGVTGGSSSAPLPPPGAGTPVRRGP